MFNQSLGQEDPLEKQMATHSWKIPWTEEGYSPWGHKEWDLSHKDLSDGAQHKLCFNILILCVCVCFPVILCIAKTIVFLHPFMLNTKYNISIFKVVNKYLTKLMGDGISDCIVTHVLRHYQLASYKLKLIVLFIHK